MANIALLGYGTVGRSAADLLTRASDRLAAAAGEPVTLQYILVRRAYPGSEHAPRFVTDFDAIERDGSVRVVAEAIGPGAQKALERQDILPLEIDGQTVDTAVPKIHDYEVKKQQASVAY